MTDREPARSQTDFPATMSLNDGTGGPEPPSPRPQRLWLHAILLAATVLTTVAAGALQQGADLLHSPSEIARGIPFSFTLLLILLTHEMGHYLASRHHGVEATLPYFIPAPPVPFLIGTFGAFIRMRSPIRDRRALLDIGASGPIAGFVVSIAAVAVGLHYSQVVRTDDVAGLGLGSPIVFKLISDLVVGPVENGFDILLHPVAFAGWIGFFVTALNLIPIGQLDGGHVVYAVLGKHHRTVSIAMVAILLALSFLGWAGWILWALIPLILGISHPPTQNPEEPLDGARKFIGWATFAIFVLTFTPVPFFVV